MNRIIKWLGVICLCLSSTLLYSGESEDWVISVPEGWIIDDPGPYAASPVSNAVVAWQIQDGYIVRSIVIQAALTGAQHTTEFDGKVHWIQYAPDGSSLLAQRTDDVHGPGMHGVHLLDNEGQILWSKYDRRSFEYSSTGEVLWARRIFRIDGGPGGNDIELFDLSGASLKTISQDPAPWDAIVIGAGEQVLLANKITLLSLDTSDGAPTTDWTFVAPTGYGDFAGMKLLDDQNILWKTTHFVYVAIDVADGSLKYTYDPVALAANDARADKYKYASYQLLPGPAPGTITLFDGTSGIQTLNIGSAELAASSIDVEPPGKAFEEKPFLANQRLFFFSPHEVRVRPIR